MIESDNLKVLFEAPKHMCSKFLGFDSILEMVVIRLLFHLRTAQPNGSQLSSAETYLDIELFAQCLWFAVNRAAATIKFSYTWCFMTSILIHFQFQSNGQNKTDSNKYKKNTGQKLKSEILVGFNQKCWAGIQAAK